MAQELLYTSAPRGLKSGSRGFCTVEATAGLSPALVTALEGLSGYRHVAAPGDPANPVVYSHIRLSVAGRRCSVVSRIADAGADYTGRTNKLAHHLALDAPERPKGGPAWLAGQPNLLRSQFEGEPRTLPPRVIPQGDHPLAVCKAWKTATGDAGWAGVLAEVFLADPNRQAYLVIPSGLDVRPLYEEAIALLPPDRRWEPTFTTCYTSLPQNVTCQWRAVLAGSKEAHESRRFVQALRIDLTQPLGTATGGALVEAARTGRMPAVSTSPPAARKSPAAAALARSTGSATTLDDAPLDVMPASTQRRPTQFLIEPLERPPALQRRSRLRAALWAGAAVLCLVVIVSPGVLLMMYVSKGTKAETQMVAVHKESFADGTNVRKAALNKEDIGRLPTEPVPKDVPRSREAVGQSTTTTAQLARHREPELRTNVGREPVVAPRPPRDSEDAVAGTMIGRNNPKRPIDPTTTPSRGADRPENDVRHKQVITQVYGTFLEADGLLYITAPDLEASHNDSQLRFAKSGRNEELTVVRKNNTLQFQRPDPSRSNANADYGTVAIAKDDLNRLFIAPASDRYKRFFTDDLLWDSYVVTTGDTTHLLMLWDEQAVPSEITISEQRIALPLPNTKSKPVLTVSLKLAINFARDAADSATPSIIEFRQSDLEESHLRSKQLESVISDLVVNFESSSGPDGETAEAKALRLNAVREDIGNKIADRPPRLPVSFKGKVLITVDPEHVFACFADDVAYLGGEMKKYRLVSSAFRLGAITQEAKSYQGGVRKSIVSYRDKNISPQIKDDMKGYLDKLDAINLWAEAIRNAGVVDASVSYKVKDADGTTFDIEVFRFPSK